MAEVRVPNRFNDDVSPCITGIKVAETYLVCCVGVDRDTTHVIRNAYRYGISNSAALLAQHKPDYVVKIIGIYNEETYEDILGRVLPLKPSLLILGRQFQAPYSPRFRDLVRRYEPAIMRMGKTRLPISEMPDPDYYLGTYAVFPESDISDSAAVSNDIDYGILVNLNMHKHVSVEKMYVDLGSEYKDSSAFLRSVLESDSTVCTANDTVR